MNGPAVPRVADSAYRAGLRVGAWLRARRDPRRPTWRARLDGVFAEIDRGMRDGMGRP